MTIQIIENKQIKPFLRWAGGKTWLTKRIHGFLPSSFNNYHEPFLGGASIFIHLKSKGLITQGSFLSDSNHELINSYKQLQENPHALINRIRGHRNTEEEYYQVRASRPRSALDQAARFIYLNRTSFNGIYRVNQKGEYNVPYGHKTTKDLYGFDNMLLISEMLNQNVNLDSGDFYSCLTNIVENDLVFLDPPYTVAHENNGFIQYNQKIFKWEDQERLLELIKEIINRGAYYILTNAVHFSIKELFSNYGNRYKVPRTSTIGGKGAARDKVNEYLFSNIKL